MEKEEPTGWADTADEDGDEDDDKSAGDHKSAHKGDDDVTITIGRGNTKTGVNRRREEEPKENRAVATDIPFKRDYMKHVCLSVCMPV